MHLKLLNFCSEIREATSGWMTSALEDVTAMGAKYSVRTTAVTQWGNVLLLTATGDASAGMVSSAMVLKIVQEVREL